MSLSYVNQLGTMLGRSLSDQSNIRENINPDDSTDALLITDTSNIVLQSTLVVSALTIATDSFVIDHPVYGYVDSAVYKIDGGYSGSPTILDTITF